MARILIALLAATMLVGCRVDVLDMVKTDSEDVWVHCGNIDLRYEETNDLVPITENTTYDIGDVVWVVVLVKQSPLMDASYASDRIGMSWNSDRFELIQPNDNLVVYEEENYKAGLHEQNVHVLLDEIYIDGITYKYTVNTFRYKSHEGSKFAFYFNYLFKTTDFSLSGSAGVNIDNTGSPYEPEIPDRYIGPIVPNENCHPSNWNIIPFEGEYLQLMNRCYNDEEWKRITSANSLEEMEEIEREIIRQYWIEENGTNTAD